MGPARAETSGTLLLGAAPAAAAGAGAAVEEEDEDGGWDGAGAVGC